MLLVRTPVAYLRHIIIASIFTCKKVMEPIRNVNKFTNRHVSTLLFVKPTNQAPHTCGWHPYELEWRDHDIKIKQYFSNTLGIKKWEEIATNIHRQSILQDHTFQMCVGTLRVKSRPWKIGIDYRYYRSNKPITQYIPMTHSGLNMVFFLDKTDQSLADFHYKQQALSLC